MEGLNDYNHILHFCSLSFHISNSELKKIKNSYLLLTSTSILPSDTSHLLFRPHYENEGFQMLQKPEKYP